MPAPKTRTWIPALSAIIAPAVLVLLAGCGAEDDPAAPARPRARAPELNVGDVKNCIRRRAPDAQATTRANALDDVARKASVGGLVVRFDVDSVYRSGRNSVMIALERTPEQAQATEARYRAVYRGLNVDPAGRLFRRETAVGSYFEKPSATERRVIDGCL